MSIFSDLRLCDPVLSGQFLKSLSSSVPKGGRSSLEFSINNGKKKIQKATGPVVQTLDSTIHRINRYPADK